MSNADFFAFFPEEEATPSNHAQGLEDLGFLFNQDNGIEKQGNEASQNFPTQGDDDLEGMLAGLEMLEEMLVESDRAGELAMEEMSELEQETSLMFEGDDLDPAESVVDPLEYDHDCDADPSSSLGISLTPPFLKSYQNLEVQVVNLSQQLVERERQLVAGQRRAASAESLIQHQAIALTQTQEQLAETVAELQVYQETAKQQQLQVENLTMELAASESRLGELQQMQSATPPQMDLEKLEQLQCQVASLTQENRNLTQQLQEQGDRQGQEVARLEKNLEELRARLQRQQVYALQYKTALEKQLAQSSGDRAPTPVTLTAPSKEIKPWASKEEFAIATVEAPPPLIPVQLEQSEPQPSSLPIMVRPPAPPEEKPKSQPVAPAKGDRLSFAVRAQKPRSRSIDLPGFLPRATPAHP